MNYAFSVGFSNLHRGSMERRANVGLQLEYPADGYVDEPGGVATTITRPLTPVDSFFAGVVNEGWQFEH